MAFAIETSPPIFIIEVYPMFSVLTRAGMKKVFLLPSQNHPAINPGSGHSKYLSCPGTE
jgi:hypothetical protein